MLKVGFRQVIVSRRLEQVYNSKQAPNWQEKTMMGDQRSSVWILKNAHSNIITHHSITHHLSLKIPQLPKMACLTLISNFDNSKKFAFCGTHRLT